MDLFGAKSRAKVPEGFGSPVRYVLRWAPSSRSTATVSARRSGAAGPRGVPPRATLFFDLGSPYTYLAAERAERLFARLEWLPASADVLHAAELTEDGCARSRDRALLLGLPFVWPEEPPSCVRGAMRVASLAAERGCGAAFVLAASRLAFCGGFDIDDPEILAEAAAAAGIGLRETLAAAGDVGARRPDRGGRAPAARRRRLAAARPARRAACCSAARTACSRPPPRAPPSERRAQRRHVRCRPYERLCSLIGSPRDGDRIVEGGAGSTSAGISSRAA